MKPEKKRRVLVLVMLVLAIAVPVFIVMKNESILSEKETLYRFSLQPIDPYDLIRGKYITLRFDSRAESDGKVKAGQSVYVEVDKDDNQRAYFKKILSEAPDHSAYFETKAIMVYENQVQFEIPFDRYYMNENLAQKAEDLYNEFSQNEDDFYADVHIKNGEALLKEVYYRGEALNQYLKKHHASE